MLANISQEPDASIFTVFAAQTSYLNLTQCAVSALPVRYGSVRLDQKGALARNIALFSPTVKQLTETFINRDFPFQMA
jgi:hypothetical protein